METPPTATINGVAYPLAWGNLARIRFSGIDKSMRESDGAVQIVTMLWASLAVKPNPFPTWEHLAEHVTQDNIGELETALLASLPKAEDAEKKSG
jgi:hypothetical protein